MGIQGKKKKSSVNIHGKKKKKNSVNKTNHLSAVEYQLPWQYVAADLLELQGKTTWSLWIIIRISSKWMRSPLKKTIRLSRKWNPTLKTEGCDVISSATVASFLLLTWKLATSLRSTTSRRPKQLGSRVSSYHRCRSETDTSTVEACTLLLGNYISRSMSVHSMVILDLDYVQSLRVWFCCCFLIVILQKWTLDLKLQIHRNFEQI